MKIKNKEKNGQVSIEALLLWATLAGMIGLFTPAFAYAMDAYMLHAQTNHYIAFSETLQEKITGIGFSAPGTQISVRVPRMENVEIHVSGSEITLTLTHAALSQDKVRTIASAWPLEGEIGGEMIILRREEGKITIQ